MREPRKVILDSRMRIYVVRHGHKANQLPEYDGGDNPPLSERGHQQAARVADRLADEEIDQLYSSAQLRALQTADPVARETAGDWHVWPLLCETSRDTVRESDATEHRVAVWPTGERIETPSSGALAATDDNYYLLSDVPDRFPGTTLSQPFPWPEAWWVPLEHQTYLTGVARISLGAEALIDRHDRGDRIAVVCHNRSGSTLISAVMGFRRDHKFPVPFDVGGITRLDLDADDTWRIKYANRTAHLGDSFESRFE